MHISKIAVQNFRLLRNVELAFDRQTTLIVGRNNSGKTSLTELFRRLLSENPQFRLEDFSLAVQNGFWLAYRAKQDGQSNDALRSHLPAIEVTLTIDYEGDQIFGPVSDLIIDLDESCTRCCLSIRYEIDDDNIERLLEPPSSAPADTLANEQKLFLRQLRARITKLYKARAYAVDPTDPANERPLEWAFLKSLIRPCFINAQRGLNDETFRDNDVLGKIFTKLCGTDATANGADNSTAIRARLESIVAEIQGQIDGEFKLELEKFLPQLAHFGYPGMADPGLQTETTVDLNTLLLHNTRFCYAGVNGVNLPETYNGLGSRNLIFMLLVLFDFFKTTRVSAGLNLVFIEEPEAHQHPQMQSVFLRQLGKMTELFRDLFKDEFAWPVQFVVSTHSPHIANEADFSSIRYFLSSKRDHDSAETVIKDLQQAWGVDQKSHRDFMHQYMTLTKCDLLFADACVLVEGAAERILYPRMMQKLEAEHNVQMANKLVTLLEVDGAHAHLFFELLNYLELRCLIITDIDSVTKGGGKACLVSKGTRTSNACIKAWFNNKDITPQELIAKPDDEKLQKSLRIAYQIPESPGQACGRSFEEAFILANRSMFEVDVSTELSAEQSASTIAAEEKKTSFALTHAYDVREWCLPRYISEGLEWLAAGLAVSTTQPMVPNSVPFVGGASATATSVEGTRA